MKPILFFSIICLFGSFFFWTGWEKIESISAISKGGDKNLTNQ